MSISEAQRRRDPHAGPGESYPLDPEHLKAAWDLAGHAANPSAVRSKVLAYARAHGLMADLPETARSHNDGKLVRKAREDQSSSQRRESFQTIHKAQAAQVQELFDLAFNHENAEGDTSEKRRLIEWAQQHGLSQHLPDEAHGFMHMQNIPHTHEGENHPMHIHTVQKAFNPVAVEWMVEKAWPADINAPDTSPVYFEGWVSKNTGKKDLQKEIVEPEAFVGAMDSYFTRRAPLSYTHGTKNLPAGHLQRAAIIRDGAVIKATTHPTDSAEFESPPDSGTGVYVRGVITDPIVGKSVRQGDTGGMSYIANLREYEPLPGGGRRHLKYDPWIESCVAPYPVNPDAAITVAKAFGLVDSSEKELSTMGNTSQAEGASKLEAALDAILSTQEEHDESVTKADIAQMLEAFKVSQQELVETVQKAITESRLPAREEGTGRVGGQDREATVRESDPVGYIVKKAHEVEGAGGDLAPEDKDLAYQLFRASMFKPEHRASAGSSADDDE